MKQKLHFKYIIVDEYQDISRQRFDLTKALSEVTDAKIIAVGDDWQSIYAFSGSDITLFTKFAEKMGYAKMLKIVNTYRNSQDVIDIAGNFIQKNKEQIPKRLISPKRIEDPVIIYTYDSRSKGKDGNRKSGANYAMARAVEIALENLIEYKKKENKEIGKILLLGRFNFDGDLLERSGLFEYVTRGSKIKSVRYPKVDITFMTAHSSKGLGYDDVIIVNGKNEIYGFPSKIEDDPVLSFVIKGDRSIDYAEERRLFYVALTRTKNRVFVVAPEQNPSEFLLEIKKDYKNVVLKGNWNAEYISKTLKKACPMCGYPMQLKYKEAYGLRLYICSNEPEICGFMTNDYSGGKMAIQKCDKCHDGYLIVKRGKKGYFLGCTNYKENGTGCDKSISMSYYYEQMGYALDGISDKPEHVNHEEILKEVTDNKPVSDKEKVSVNNELNDDYIKIIRADLKPVMYGDLELNDTIFTIVKALQNISKEKFFSEKILVDVLCGYESEKVIKDNLKIIPEFRSLQKFPYDTVQAIIEWMISQHLILKTRENYPVLHSTYDGLHYSEFITENKLKKLKKYLEEDLTLWMPDSNINIEIEKKDISKDLSVAKTILKQYFGYDSFKQGQEEIINTILNGGDALAIMPTGAGKSICYQVPALMLEGITIVVSPLISLMQDQVKALNSAGIHAAFINSSLNDSQITSVLKHAQQGEYKIIYVAPERLENNGFISLSKELHVSMVSVDEAHCISQWGQDFRPSYLKIIQFIKSLKTRPIISAFTATATEEVKEDIISTLNLNDPQITITGFNRENLYFVVETDVDKNDYVLEYIERHPGDSGIIYCLTRKNVENLYEILFKAGVPVTKYHAGLDSEERKNNQNDFIFDKAPIMVATNAFGMGIDKSNVRFVIHYNMPQSMENYYQEAGRAGRDGIKADCILLYSTKDVMTQKWLLDHKEFADINSENIIIIRERDTRRLHVIENYCKTTECLRNYILNYFGERNFGPCDNCGNCHREYIETDMTDAAKKVINCVFESKGRYGATVITGTLVGANRAKLREFGTVNYKTYGALANYKETDIRDLINTLIQDEYLVQTMDKFNLLKMGPRVEDLHNPNTHIIVRIHKEKEIIKSIRKIKPRITDSLTTSGYKLFEKLRKLRTNIAREEGMPPYIVFGDKTLIDMCVRLPKDKLSMMNVFGMGRAKYAKYGERFLAAICEFIEENPDVLSGMTTNEDGEKIVISKVRKQKSGRKVDFYINEDDIDVFEYSEFYFLNEICDELNRITTADNVKKCKLSTIWKLLVLKGYVYEAYVNGAWIKRPTAIGLEKGIITVEKTSDSGFKYMVLKYPENIQREVAESYIKNDWFDELPEEDEETENIHLSEIIDKRIEYNRKMNRPDGAGASWSEEEDNRLLSEYRDKIKISEIAKNHNRTVGAIRSRLKKHGLIT